jgi:REP element-mobilizing transposase RayT
VHLAVRVHPTVSPARLFVQLMNDAQQHVWERFPQNVVRAGVERLWQSSGCIGSYGKLASPQVGRYIRDWEASAGGSNSVRTTGRARGIGVGGAGAL